MKNKLSLIALFLITIFILSCKGGEGPEVAAKAYLDAINEKDIEKAQKFAVEESESMIDSMLASIHALNIGQESDNQIITKSMKCKINAGDKSVCTFINLENKEDSLNLEKIGDEWLVNLHNKGPQLKGFAHVCSSCGNGFNWACTTDVFGKCVCGESCSGR